MTVISANPSSGIILNINRNSDSLLKTYERLSSGMRVSGASDDAAALQLLTRTRSESKAYAQAVKNVNDGISLLNVANSAVGALKNVLTSMQEITTQAGNSNISSDQRDALDTELETLRTEYNRIVESTEYNGSALFSGSNQSYLIQAGITSGSESRIQIALTTSGSQTTATGTFGAVTSYSSRDSSGPGGHDIIFHDFNDDGNLDFVTSDRDEGVIFVQMGNGDGTFQTRVSYAVAAEALDLTMYDLNNDGNQDLVITEQNTDKVHVVLGNSDGTFQTAVSYAAGIGARSGAIGDLNGDGNADLVVMAENDGTVLVFNGNGDGTFDAAVSYASGNGNTVILADVNNDNHLDIISDNFSGDAVNVFLNNGSGTFGAAATFSAGDGAREVISGDWDGDGNVDLAVATSNAGKLNILMGNGNGTFDAAVSYGPVISQTGITSGDVNGDGITDIVTSGSALEVFIGNGNGTFQTATSYALDHGVGLMLADINNDGVLDVGVNSFTNATHSVEIRLGQSQTSTVTFGVSTIDALDLTSLYATGVTSRTLSSVDTEITAVQGALSASLSRLDVASEITNTMKNYLSDAASRIEDIDPIAELTNLARQQAVQTAGQAALEQATQQVALRGKLITDTIA